MTKHLRKSIKKQPRYQHIYVETKERKRSKKKENVMMIIMIFFKLNFKLYLS